MQKKYRLTSSRSFDFIYKKGESCSDRRIVILFLASKYPTIKVGFSVGKKVGGSVVRNKVRRRLKEAFRHLLPGVTTGYSYVVVARTGSDKCTYKELEQSLISLLTRAGKLEKSE